MKWKTGYGQQPLVKTGKTTLVYVIGVNDAKDTFMHRLHNIEGAGCWHFLMECDHEWFDQLTNEIVRKKFYQGRLIRKW